jgi:serine/threonine protein kinase
MQYLPHPDLSTRRDGGHFFTGTPAEALRVFRDISSALVYLHEKNILHNDIKPGNIVSSPGEPPILIDFGVASEYDPDSAPSGGGTLFYLPREYMIEGSRGPPSDVFALAVTILYLLRKIPLPESTERGWRFGHANFQGPDREAMRAWFDKVDNVTKNLDSSGND